MPKRLAHSVGHAVHGFLHVWRGERNFRLQCMAAAAAIGVMIWLEFTALETAIIILCMAAVLGAEMFNTFVEDLLDVVHPDHHPAVGKIKDLMAGIVLFASVAALIVGLITVAHHVR
jgi:diacylglycerol kinase (ATP)